MKPNLDYTVRRHFVDGFCFRNIPALPRGSRVLDLGGNRIEKRGRFDIERYGLRVMYADLSARKRPHVQADAADLPFKEGSFDAVVCFELLEHVPDPLRVVREIHRSMRQGGTVFICVPFLYRMHDDPYDYGRYTDQYWKRNLAMIGFQEIRVERQGLFWSVLVGMLREWAHQASIRRRPRSSKMRRHIARFVSLCTRRAIAADQKLELLSDAFFSSFTTGFGIRASK